jgi:hypothetical protein
LFWIKIFHGYTYFLIPSSNSSLEYWGPRYKDLRGRIVNLDLECHVNLAAPIAVPASLDIGSK